jgi:AraC-like DNA-binding protein
MAESAFGESRISYARFGAPIRLSLRGTPFYRVFIPFEGEAGVRLPGLGGLRATSETGIVVSTESGVELQCAGGYAHAAISFPQELLHRELERLTNCTVTETVRFAPSIDLLTSANSLWRHLLRAATASAHQSDGIVARSIPSRRLERRLLTLLLTEQTHSYTGDIRRPQTSLVQRAIDIVEDRPNYHWTVDELAASVWCSVRTLQASFHKTMGVTPTEYVRWVRLQRVRADLQSSTSGLATVTDIATSWGFSHMGRFSAAYHEEFQEYPRETLRGVRQSS